VSQDAKKAEENFKDHGVAFEEAQEVFLDPKALDFLDSQHSTLQESRYKHHRLLITPPSLRCLH
jgi:uncharacterized DUF497 family protein